MQVVQIRLLRSGMYDFNEDLKFPIEVTGTIDSMGDVYVSGFELHNVSPDSFDNDNCKYIFPDGRGDFEVLS